MREELGRSRNCKILNLYNFRACGGALHSKRPALYISRYFEYVATWTAPILYIFTFVRLISSAILEGKEAAFQVVYSLPCIIAF